MAKQRGPGRPKKTNHEMHGKNPKANLKKDAQEVGKKGKKLVKDAMKATADTSLSIYQKTINFLKEVPSMVVNTTKSFFIGIFEVIKNGAKSVLSFLKGFTDKGKINKGALSIKLLASVIACIVGAILAGQYIMSYLTLQQIAMIATGTSAAAYVVHRLSSDKEVRENTEVSLTDMILPKGGQFTEVISKVG